LYFGTPKPGRTSPAVRDEIRRSDRSHAELARRFGVSVQTIRKWRRSDSVIDGSHRPKRLQTTLDGAQEDFIVGLRVSLRLSLDDLLALSALIISSSLTRSALDRTLRRRGISKLGDLKPNWPPRLPDGTLAGAVLTTLFPIRYGAGGQRRVHVLVALSSCTRQAHAACCRHLTAPVLAGFVEHIYRLWPTVSGAPCILVGPDGIERSAAASDLGSEPLHSTLPPALKPLLVSLRARAKELSQAATGRVDTLPGAIGGDAGFSPPVPDTLSRWQEHILSALDAYRALKIAQP
jgi:transposase-like protein